MSAQAVPVSRLRQQVQILSIDGRCSEVQATALGDESPASSTSLAEANEQHGDRPISRSWTVREQFGRTVLPKHASGGRRDCPSSEEAAQSGSLVHDALP